MQYRKKFIFAVVVIIFVISNVSFAYLNVIDLGTLAGESSSMAYSVNDSGQIVGWSSNGGSDHACLFDATGGGANIGLGTLGGVSSTAMSINNSGQIVGSAYRGSSGGTGACLFDATGGGANTDLGEGYANSINNNGVIAGSSGGHACLFASPNIDLGTLGGSESSVYSINNNGQMAGYADGRACVFDASGSGDNTALSDNQSCAYSINDNGYVVGSVMNNSGDWVACLFSFESFEPYSDPPGFWIRKDLGTLGGNHGTALSINNNGQIVGSSHTSTSIYSHACLFDSTGGGNNIDLNTLIDPACGWTLYMATDINNNGWIVGVGAGPDGSGHAYLLVIPEPEAILLLAFGGLGVMRKMEVGR